MNNNENQSVKKKVKNPWFGPLDQAVARIDHTKHAQYCCEELEGLHYTKTQITQSEALKSDSDNIFRVKIIYTIM